jgi:hypothetical protein
MTVEPFPLIFGPARRAVELLATIANDAASPYQKQAADALEEWRGRLATREQIAMVRTDNEVTVDRYGACVTEGEDGFFIQTWTWVECEIEDPEDEEPKP